MNVFLLILCAVMGYAVGSVNSSILVGKLFGTDVRTQGSKNAGLTNTYRVLGSKAALLVLVGDILKGVIAVLLGTILYKWSDGAAITEVFAVAAGIFAVIGHNWPVYFDFKGGKGILTTATVVFMLDWRIGIIALCVFVVIILISKFVSLGSIMAAVTIPVTAFILDHSPAFVVFMFLLAILAIYRHKANIIRLVNGTENKLKSKNKSA